MKRFFFVSIAIAFVAAFWCVMPLSTFPYRWQTTKDVIKSHFLSYYLNDKLQDLTEESGVNNVDSPEEGSDKIRAFLNRYTIHLVDDDFWNYSGTKEMVSRLYKSVFEGGDPVKLECSTRSVLATYLLEHLSYNTRYVSVYADPVYSHTFLEIFNTKTQKWEIIDIDYNIYWKHKSSGERAGIEELVKSSSVKDEFIPCQSKDNCGWGIRGNDGQNPADILPNFGLATVLDVSRGKRIVYSNSQLFPLSKIFDIEGKKQTFCQRWSELCYQSVVEF